MLRIFAALALVGCLDSADPLPACPDLGCPNSPSGVIAGEWEPCSEEQEVCFCRVGNHETLACVR